MIDQQIAGKATPIVFEGKTSEYFGIWIVNLLLSIVTLGIYSAWAKVRRKKYFYNNTLIDGVGFDYHANPKAIFKGRMIAAAFFGVYSASGNISPMLSGILGIILFLAIPWIVVRAALFNARNTSHRGLRFDFVGTTAQARKVYLFLPMLMIFTLGLIYPYITHQRKHFLMSHHRFGLSQFNMQPVVKKFYKVYLIFIIVPLIGILAAIAIPAYQAYVNKAKAASQLHSELQVPFAMALVDSSQQKIVLAANEATTEAPAQVNPAEIKKVERIYSDDVPPHAGDSETSAASPKQAEAAAVERVYVEPNAADTSATNTAPDQLEQQANAEFANNMDDEAQAGEELGQEKSYEEMRQEKKEARDEAIRGMLNPQKIGFIFGAILAYLVFGFGFWGYIQARIGNLVWNNTTLDKLSFKSSLRARDLIAIYMTNILAIICTFGLATPWAQIRLARYRASKLEILGDVDFDQFVGDKKEEMKATGEEIADFFDIDFSFG